MNKKAQYDKKYLEKLLQQGFSKICVAVPESNRKELMGFCKALRVTDRKKRGVK